MTYYPDLSKYVYHNGDRYPNTLNVGWLDISHDYPQGEVSNAFIEQLWAFCRIKARPMRGFHTCQFCGMSSNRVPTAKRGRETLKLGWAEIRVVGQKGIMYAAPNLIYHYVVKHHYHPPDEFIEAVLTGPLPGTQEYDMEMARLKINFG